MHIRNSTMQGFTLVEAMAALAIVAIIAVIGFPTYTEAVRKTKRAEAKSALLQLMQQQEEYYSRHNTYIAFSAAAAAGFKWYSGKDAASSAYEFIGQGCPRGSLQECVAIEARPGTANVDRHYRDDACGTLKLTSSGLQEASGGASGCW